MIILENKNDALSFKYKTEIVVFRANSHTKFLSWIEVWLKHNY
jgi:hypothetical protein